MGIGKNAAMHHTNEVGCGKRDDEVKGEVAGGLAEGGQKLVAIDWEDLCKEIS
jgi:hypothetical protein